jgi:hypothetical protein
MIAALLQAAANRCFHPFCARTLAPFGTALLIRIKWRDRYPAKYDY